MIYVLWSMQLRVQHILFMTHYYIYRFTYEMAPVYSIMENECISQMLTLAGIPGGDGILCPGGSISNLLALNAARYRYVCICVRACIMYVIWSEVVVHVWLL